MELISGWTQWHRGADFVVMTWLEEGQIQARRFPTRWTFFVRGADEDDRKALIRLPEVVGAKWEGDYLRVDCPNRWDRRSLAERIQEQIDAAALSQDVGDAMVCEADVDPLRRLIADNSRLSISTEHRVGYLDIEVDSRVSIDEQVEGNARILCWVVRLEDGTERRGLLRADDDADERWLLEEFLVAIDDCDLLLAWYGDGYDFKVLERRISELDARTPRGTVPELRRWCWMDALELFRKYNRAVAASGDEKSSMKLGDVGERIAGVPKLDFDASKTWQAWEAGGASRQELLDYCARDVEILPAIEAKVSYLELHREVCRICNVFPDTASLGAVAQGDGFLLRLGSLRGHRWPTKQGVEAERFEGAWVMEPTRLGAVEGVSVADFAGLYPSIMRSFNLSPETVVKPHHDQGPVITVPERPTKFRADVRGLVPEALDTLVAERAKYQKEQGRHQPGSDDWKHAYRLSTALKIVANSFYGIVGSGWSRFSSKRVAEAVTTTGAWLLKQVAVQAKSEGMDPFYGDTDSIFVAVDDHEAFMDMTHRLNDRWDGILRDRFGCRECHIKLEYEKRFARLLIVSAKRYAASLSWYKGKAAKADAREVKGLEYKRGDTLRVARGLQYDVIEILLSGEELPPAESIEAVVNERKAAHYEAPQLEDLVLSQSVKALSSYKLRFTSAKCPKPCGHDFGDTDVSGPIVCPKCGKERRKSKLPIQVRVALELRERGELIVAGDRVHYFISSSEGPEGLVAVPAADVADPSGLDLDYYWHRRIWPPTARLLSAVYPTRKWVLTQKEIRVEKFRDKVDDLPLFGAGAAEVKPAKRVRRKRQRASGEGMIFDVFSSGSTPQHLDAVSAVLRAHPGSVPVTLRIRIDEDEKAVVVLKTGLSCERTKALVEGLSVLGAREVASGG